MAGRDSTDPDSVWHAEFFSGSSASRIAVGSKDFTEQIILGELLAQAIEAKTGLQVERRFDLGGNLAHQALLTGEIDVYVEYTGTALLAILKNPPLKDPRKFTGRSNRHTPNNSAVNGLSLSALTTLLPFSSEAMKRDATVLRPSVTRQRYPRGGARDLVRTLCHELMATQDLREHTGFISKKYVKWTCL